MYKLILVDDEDEVREGIKLKIDWQACGFRFVGDFDNGRDALEALDSLHPDVIVTDICMPFMDGLELAGRVNRTYPDIKTVILTGYEDFEYAKTAIKLKVADLLLKPINAKEFTAFLAKLKRELDDEFERKRNVRELQLQLNQSLPLLKERFLERMAASPLGADEIERKLRYFRLALPGPGYLALVMDADDSGSTASGAPDADAELLHFAAFNIVQEIFEKENGGIAFRTRDEKTAVFLSGDPKEIGVLAQQLANQAAHNIAKYLKLSVSFGIGRIGGGKTQLSHSYREALSALDYRFYLGKNRIIAIDDLEYGAPAVRFNDDGWEEKLLSAIRTGSRERVAGVLRNWTGEWKRAGAPVERCYGSVHKLAVMLMSHAAEAGLDDAEVFAGYPFQQIAALKTLDEAALWLERICGRILVALNEKRTSVARSQMLAAERFIRDNYHRENLALRHVCSHVYMSISYFSALFKEYTGETFVEYLTRIRMDKARELLAGSAMKTYEVASSVGYGDPQYFSVVFKRTTGTSPTEFRTARKGQPIE